MRKTTPTILLALCLAWTGRAASADDQRAREKKRLAEIAAVPNARTLQDMARLAFAAMSDNKGRGVEDPDVANMAARVRAMRAKFVIGLGDNLHSARHKGFLVLLKQDRFWANYFWPNIGDGENAHFAGRQDAWGAGKPLLHFLEIEKRPRVTMAANGIDYYTRLPFEDLTVHLIQLTYSDEPDDHAVAFREETRAFLETTLKRLPRSPRDIIVAAAHSNRGEWLSVLSRERAGLVLDKCDLVLAATTHLYRRFDYGEESALVLNTGQTGEFSDSEKERDLSGFLGVYVLDDPLCLVTLYHFTRGPEPILPAAEYCAVRFQESGRIYPLAFKAVQAGAVQAEE